VSEPETAQAAPTRYCEDAYEYSSVKLSVGVTCYAYLLEIDDLSTQGSRPGRTFGKSVGGIFEIGSSDLSNGIRYHTFDTRSDTELKLNGNWCVCVRVRWKSQANHVRDVA